MRKKNRVVNDQLVYSTSYCCTITVQFQSIVLVIEMIMEQVKTSLAREMDKPTSLMNRNPILYIIKMDPQEKLTFTWGAFSPTFNLMT